MSGGLSDKNVTTSPGLPVSLADIKRPEYFCMLQNDISSLDQAETEQIKGRRAITVRSDLRLFCSVLHKSVTNEALSYRRAAPHVTTAQTAAHNRRLHVVGDILRMALVFYVVYGLCLCLGLLCGLFVVTWSLSWRGGFAWDGSLQHFNWHPVLMVCGLLILYGNGKKEIVTALGLS